MLWACDHSEHGEGESTSALMLADLRLYIFCKSQLDELLSVGVSPLGYRCRFAAAGFGRPYGGLFVRKLVASFPGSNEPRNEAILHFV